MQAFDRDLFHFVGDRVIAISSQAVDAGPDQEMRSGFLGRAEKLVDIGLVSPMWTHCPASPRSSVDCWTFSILQPPDAFLLLDWNARRIMNFFGVQNLTAASPSGSPSIVTARLECIRMPQTVCDLRRPALSGPAVYALGYPDRVRILSLIGELRAQAGGYYAYDA
jgi:hypothetical protein